MGGAFAVFQLLKEEDKRDFDWIKAALYTAFAADGFMAFDQFVKWQGLVWGQIFPQSLLPK